MRGMTHLLLAAAFTLVGAFPALAQEGCARAIESGFSFCPPTNWTIRSAMAQKFKLFVGPNAGAITPTINVNDEESALDLDAHVAANIKSMMADPAKAGVTSVKLISQADFVTESGERTVRVAMLVDIRGTAVSTLQYYFKGRGRQYFVMTSMAPEVTRALYDPLFDRAARTLRVDH
jgi:hypothetical protein